MTPTVLIVEDDPDIVELVTLDMRDLGFAVECAADGETGLALAEQRQFSLLILDLMLPGLGGLEVCRRLRVTNPTLPIMMLTARDDDVTMVLGFETGADEYLTKPFKSIELKARVRALLRRSQLSPVPGAGGARQQFGELEIDFAAREVSVAGEPILLTAIEFDLLQFFASAPGRVFTRQDLLQGVWGVDTSGYEYNVNTHVSRLRAKLKTKKGGSKDYILTLRGVGYRFLRPDELATDGPPEAA